MNDARTSGAALATGTDDLDPPLEEPLEEGSLPPRPPQLEVDFSRRVHIYPHAIAGNLDVDAVDRSLVTAVESVGQAEQGGQFGDPLLTCGRE
jgi:hypothetical protein